MMTTGQLAQRLAQKMWGSDFARLTMTAAEELRDGINTALDEFGSYLPAHRTVREASFVVDGPQSATINVVALSSTITLATALPIGAYATTSDLVARGLVVTGQPQVNRLLSTTEMLMPWLGSTGAVAGTLYGDGIPLSARIDQLAGDVTWLRAGTSERLALSARQDFPMTSAYHSAPSSGEPAVWWVESFGGHDAQEVRLVLRLWPLPASRGLLTVKLKQFAAPVTLTDLHVTTRSLPVDDLEQGHLVALCAGHLVNAAGLREDLDKAAVGRVAETSRTLLSNRANHNPSAVPNQVGTPHGW